MYSRQAHAWQGLSAPRAISAKARSIAGLAVVLLASSCAPGPGKTLPSRQLDLPPANARGTSLNAKIQPSSDWIYDVEAAPGATELRVEARFPPGSGTEIGNDEEVTPFLRDLCVVTTHGCEPVSWPGPNWSIGRCETEGCQLRYRFALAEAAKALRDPDLAVAYDGVVISPPSSWFVRPLSERAGTFYQMHVVTAPGDSFVTAVPPLSGESATFRGSTSDLPFGPYSAFGRLQIAQRAMGSSQLDIARGQGEFDVGELRVTEWIDDAARVVSDYFHHFPVDRALLVVVPTEGAGLGYGKALGYGGASMLLPIGRRTTAPEFDDDWVLVHEMLHLGFPSLPHQHIWLAEGVATYVEPLARARSGSIGPQAVWQGLVRGLPNGLPREGDRGLDNTHTWGRTYWGGALFCLVVDIAIREKTNNARSLDDALRAVVDDGGTIAARWDIARVIDVGDRATGVTVLRDVYRSMAEKPEDVDLARLWQRLGIRRSGAKITFDETAPLASIRRSLTARVPAAAAGGAPAKEKERSKRP